MLATKLAERKYKINTYVGSMVDHLTTMARDDDVLLGCNLEISLGKPPPGYTFESLAEATLKRFKSVDVQC